MVVNDAPGEECRIAILEDNHLEELYTERVATATNVGNIYKGRVVNVEPAIQAAFVDYGRSVNGFLHISDLHPRYFPGAERVEQVGKKIPRRERPPIQAALRRGDEVLVQVLKEGIGTKGPTLTSYLSIPGRLLVLMPDMDRVGVSRKFEDEEGRREMRKVLDSLDLPEGFGFILRTAGIGRTKTELKRDVAYLTRLWKVMEKRIKNVGAPCELYTESDLLIRTVRDVLRPSIKAIIVDSESAEDRLNTFLQVVAPRSAPPVVRYRRRMPIFHAFDIERQIELIHSREVPLASGGRLVIDQTEALVAIDVNSGKSRAARDSETNAFTTNREAVDEIARQLRLRDLGGLIIHDLIDMRQHKHRRLIEERFQEHLKRDRAKTTMLRISEFGLIEMTRQRMRPSMRKAHFITCPHCDGHGEIKSPDSVAADVTRHVGYLLSHDRIRRLEIVCSPRVASVLLSRKRRELVRIEDETVKRVEVRVSDDIAVDRVDYYAYDDRNADINIEHLPLQAIPDLETLMREHAAPPEPAAAEAPGDGRRRRRRRGGPADATAIALAGGFDFDDEEEEEEEEGEELGVEAAGAEAKAGPQDGEPGERKRRRRRRRRGRGGRDGAPPGEAGEPRGEAAPAIRVHALAKEMGVTSRDILDACEAGAMDVKNHMSIVPGGTAATLRGILGAGEAEEAPTEGATAPAPGTAADGPPRRRRRRRGGRGRGRGGADRAAGGGDRGEQSPAPVAGADGAAAPPPSSEPTAEGAAEPGVRKKRRRRRRGSERESEAPGAAPAAAIVEVAAQAPTAPAKKRRSLYGGARRPVSAAQRELEAASEDSG
jgi:ribonuclease E